MRSFYNGIISVDSSHCSKVWIFVSLLFYRKKFVVALNHSSYRAMFKTLEVERARKYSFSFTVRLADVDSTVSIKVEVKSCEKAKSTSCGDQMVKTFLLKNSDVQPFWTQMRHAKIWKTLFPINALSLVLSWLQYLCSQWNADEDFGSKHDLKYA